MNKTSTSRLTLDVYDLVESNDYEFRVFAENEAGQGKPSEATRPITAKNPFKKPGQPGSPEVKDIKKDSVNLTWAVPDYDGGKPIENYVIEAKSSADYTWRVMNASQKCLRPSYLARGLTTGVTYEFRVAAVNEVGQGPVSLPSRPAKCRKYNSKNDIRGKTK